jgi:uncharacterized protein (TIGR04255 family)
MAEPRHLRNAPITEMLFDIRLAASGTFAFTPAQLDAIRRAVADRYPRDEEKQRFEGTVKIEQGRLVADNQLLGSKGLFVKTEDELTVGQFRPDGFTFNRLRPYTRWEELFPEALRLWRIYTDVSGRRDVARVGLRYINHLDLPLREGDDFAEWMEMPPGLPEGLPSLVTAFNMQFTVKTDDAGQGGVNITQRMGPETPPKVLVDIDAFRLTQGEAVPDDEGIADIFTSLHELKNRIFFSLLKERCLQLFQ